MKTTTIFKTSLVISMMTLGLLAASWVAGASAEQPPAPPGQGPCSHGNTGKECKPDPSENGKDCDLHGNNGGVNEDHCLATTTTTDETTTTNGTSTTTTTTTIAIGGTTTAGTSTTPAVSSPPNSGVLGSPPTQRTAPPNKTPTKEPRHGDAAVLAENVSSGQLAFTP
jgi:hypothetical protein